MSAVAIHVHLGLLLLLATVPLSAQTNPVPVPSATRAHTPTTDSKAVPKQPTPTVFQADEGDRWTLLGDKPFIFKVDPRSIGSDALVVGTEEMPPGNKIPTHKHLHEDEVIFVHKGAVRVTLAGREYDAGTGATVLIPHGNWIGVANVFSEPAMILLALTCESRANRFWPVIFAQVIQNEVFGANSRL